MSRNLIIEWTPEDEAFWRRKGRNIALQNLWISIPALTLAFAVWMVWSVVVVKLPAVGFKFSTNQLFWLAALPGLFGATLRIFYSFMVPIFGGRRWTAISTASLLLPAIGIYFAVQNLSTSYSTFVILALLSGFGGGNFASSMANISFFFPRSKKGLGLGLNAGLGNLGVSLVQFVVPLVISIGIFGALGGGPQSVVQKGQTSHVWLQNAGLVWVPFIVVVSLAAWFGMHDLAEAEASFAEQAVIFKRKHTWVMSFLYTGTFGSFIGYSAGMPLLIKSQFPGINALDYAWLGPLVGALARPIGGWLADKLGGARVTFWNFILMALGALVVLVSLPHAHQGGNFIVFLWAFLILFATTGIGNGSTFRMIPVIFLTDRRRAAIGMDAAGQEQARKDANKESAAAIGFISAVAAYGAFYIPKTFGSSISLTGGPQAALYFFIAFYAMCTLLTWWQYSRKNAAVPC
ncbi:nitrate/nitrite transporter [Thiomonas sp. X19]|uniref:NarK family nitrate/nitrite MFS transporter n=1 Tax=Thiomonas sp. X19 TaxID=1050370 RepID=UPI000B7462CE|nr:NarK family nitrate/nitrite MFS transporter [Thiomonas sp. X19]SCC94237.1 nitrate/nitrite transporter [Thiomonas sp. X19]